MKSGADDFANERHLMADRLAGEWCLSDSKVIKVLANLPRHRFVPEASYPLAYQGHCIIMDGGYSVSDAGLVAFMVEALKLRPKDRVLDIGCGSGFHAAFLAELAAEVYGIDRLPDAVARAKECLATLGVDNVHLHVGDGFFGLPQFAPYDAINIACGVAEVPAPLIGQLKPGGKMILPYSPSGLPPDEAPQKLLLIEKRGDADLSDSDLTCCTQTELKSVRFMMMTR